MNQKMNNTTQTSVPRTPPKLLPGRTSYYWYQRVFGYDMAGLVAVAVLMIIVYLLPVGNPIRFPFMLVVLVVGCIVGVELFIAGFLVTLTDRREKKAGYTTTYDYRKKNLWQLDPDTGEVLRRPGEPIPKRKK